MTVFVNGQAVQAPPASSLRTILALHDPALATALGEGRATATDARALPVDPDAPARAGAIFRVAGSARRTADPADDA